MFAVIGQWRMDRKLDDEHHTGLQKMVAGFGQCPVWLRATGSATPVVQVRHTFIGFDDVAAAERFGSSVRVMPRTSVVRV